MLGGVAAGMNVTPCGSNSSLSRISNAAATRPCEAETRTVLGLALSASYNAPIEETEFGVFRM